MPASGNYRLVSTVDPGALAGTANVQQYGSSQAALVVSTSETVAQIICDPDDYAGGGTDPEWTFELEGGSDDDISPGTLTGATWRILQNITGEANDFTDVRAVHVAVEPLVAGDAVLLRGVLSMGNLTGTSEFRMALPLQLDSAGDADSSDFAGAAVVLPAGFTFNVSHPLRLRLYESTNARIVITLQGT